MVLSQQDHQNTSQRRGKATFGRKNTSYTTDMDVLEWPESDQFLNAIKTTDNGLIVFDGDANGHTARVLADTSATKRYLCTKIAKRLG